GGSGAPPGTAIDHAALLASPHDLSDPLRPSSYFFDATGDNFADIEVEALTKVVADLGSCVYESPGNISSGATLPFLDVAPATQPGGQPTTVNMKYSNTGCTGDSSTNPLWVYDSQHIHVCPTTCARLVNSASLLQQAEIGQTLSAGGDGGASNGL